MGAGAGDTGPAQNASGIFAENQNFQWEILEPVLEKIIPQRNRRAPESLPTEPQIHQQKIRTEGNPETQRKPPNRGRKPPKRLPNSTGHAGDEKRRANALQNRQDATPALRLRRLD